MEEICGSEFLTFYLNLIKPQLNITTIVSLKMKYLENSLVSLKIKYLEYSLEATLTQTKKKTKKKKGKQIQKNFPQFSRFSQTYLEEFCERGNQMWREYLDKMVLKLLLGQK